VKAGLVEASPSQLPPPEAVPQKSWVGRWKVSSEPSDGRGDGEGLGLRIGVDVGIEEGPPAGMGSRGCVRFAVCGQDEVNSETTPPAR